MCCETATEAQFELAKAEFEHIVDNGNGRHRIDVIQKVLLKHRRLTCNDTAFNSRRVRDHPHIGVGASEQGESNDDEVEDLYESVLKTKMRKKPRSKICSARIFSRSSIVAGRKRRPLVLCS